MMSAGCKLLIMRATALQAPGASQKSQRLSQKGFVLG